MKKTISRVSALIHMMTRPFTKESEKMVFANALPKVAKQFVMQHFPGRSIAFVERCMESNDSMFVVTLNDGSLIEFGENGNWELVDVQMGAVPASLIPNSVSAWMGTYYPNSSVVKVRKCEAGFELTFSNYVTLKFDKLDQVA